MIRRYSYPEDVDRFLLSPVNQSLVFYPLRAIPDSVVCRYVDEIDVTPRGQDFGVTSQAGELDHLALLSDRVVLACPLLVTEDVL